MKVPYIMRQWFKPSSCRWTRAPGAHFTHAVDSKWMPCLGGGGVVEPLKYLLSPRKHWVPLHARCSKFWMSEFGGVTQWSMEIKKSFLFPDINMQMFVCSLSWWCCQPFILKGSLLAWWNGLLSLVYDPWPLLLFLSLLRLPTEASGRGGPDQASRPGREPDRHDAGHHGPRPVLLQCQADDRDGPGPAAALSHAKRHPGRFWSYPDDYKMKMIWPGGLG